MEICYGCGRKIEDPEEMIFLPVKKDGLASTYILCVYCEYEPERDDDDDWIWKDALY